jgi:hypothetical protein
VVVNATIFASLTVPETSSAWFGRLEVVEVKVADSASKPSVSTTVATNADDDGVDVSVGLLLLTVLVEEEDVLLEVVCPATCFGPFEARRLISAIMPGTTDITVRTRIKMIAAFLFFI